MDIPLYIPLINYWIIYNLGCIVVLHPLSHTYYVPGFSWAGIVVIIVITSNGFHGEKKWLINGSLVASSWIMNG